MIEVDVERRVGALDLAVAFHSDARVTALFGRSGAGKTTVINLIAGLIKPDRGRIAVDGRVLFDSAAGIDVPVHERRVGYVFQESRLFPHLTVRRNLLYGHDLVPVDDRYVELDHVVDLLGLRDVLGRRPGDLSGGERQRVAIGRALLASPRLLLLDEPLASLDAARKNEVLEYIELMRDDVRIPLVYVSHAVDEVLRLAEHVVLLASGKVAAAGTVEEIMGRPDLGASAHIFEGGTVIDAVVAAHDMSYELARLDFDGGSLVVPNVNALLGEPVRLRIRARDVSLSLHAPHGISIQNALQGHIKTIGPAAGGVLTVAVEVGSALLRSRVTRRAVDDLGLAPGLPVYALIKAVSLEGRK